jgi:hypothetical protein
MLGQWKVPTLAFVAACCLCVAAAAPVRAQQAAERPLEELRSWTLSKGDLATSRAHPYAYGLRVEMAMLRGTRWSTAPMEASSFRAGIITSRRGRRTASACMRGPD